MGNASVGKDILVVFADITGKGVPLALGEHTISSAYQDRHYK